MKSIYEFYRHFGDDMPVYKCTEVTVGAAEERCRRAGHDPDSLCLQIRICPEGGQ